MPYIALARYSLLRDAFSNVDLRLEIFKFENILIDNRLNVISINCNVLPIVRRKTFAEAR